MERVGRKDSENVYSIDTEPQKVQIQIEISSIVYYVCAVCH